MTYDWHKRYHADMIVLASRLSREEFYCYTLLVDHMHVLGRPLVDDDARIAGLIGVHWRTWRAVKERLLAINALVIRDGCLVDEAAMKALCERHERSLRASEAGQRGGRARSKAAHKHPETRKLNGLGEANAKQVLQADEGRGEESPTGSPSEDTYDEDKLDDEIPF